LTRTRLFIKKYLLLICGSVVGNQPGGPLFGGERFPERGRGKETCRDPKRNT
jgi:hypothetical protein